MRLAIQETSLLQTFNWIKIINNVKPRKAQSSFGLLNPSNTQTFIEGCNYGI
jgi:hypothetical protein